MLVVVVRRVSPSSSRVVGHGHVHGERVIHLRVQPDTQRHGVTAAGPVPPAQKAVDGVVILRFGSAAPDTRCPRRCSCRPRFGWARESTAVPVRRCNAGRGHSRRPGPARRRGSDAGRPHFDHGRLLLAVADLELFTGRRELHRGGVSAGCGTSLLVFQRRAGQLTALVTRGMVSRGGHNSIVERQRWSDIQCDQRVSIVVDTGHDFGERRGVELTGRCPVIHAQKSETS